MNHDYPVAMEKLEDRRLLSSTVSAAVLGIASNDDVSPMPVAAPALVMGGFVFIPNPNQIFLTIPNVTGIYTGQFTFDSPVNGVSGGTIAVNVTSQNGATLTANVQLGVLGFNPISLNNIFGHINLHGSLGFAGSTNVNGGFYSFLAIGHLNHTVTLVRAGTFEVTSLGVTQTGHFSLTKTA